MKKYIPLSILLVLLLIVAGVFLYKSDQNHQVQRIATSTPEWLTYINTAGGYSFEYPNYLQPNSYVGINYIPQGPSVATSTNQINTMLSPKGTPYQTMAIMVNKITFSTSDEWIASRNEAASRNKASGYMLEIQKHVNINGINATIASSLKEGNGTTYFDVFLVRDGLGYDISGNDKIASTTYERVWSSFKFIPK
jgi:hypothetical protein